MSAGGAAVVPKVEQGADGAGDVRRSTKRGDRGRKGTPRPPAEPCQAECGRRYTQAGAQRRRLGSQATGAGASQLVLGGEQLVAADGGTSAAEAQGQGDRERQPQPRAPP